MMPTQRLSEADPEIARLIREETRRQADGLELIASENFVSPAVLEAAGSVLTNKYAEGYPGQALLRRLRGGRPGRAARHRPGQEALRRRPRQRPAALRHRRPTWRSTSPWPSRATRCSAMSLNFGGHLTHGSPVNFSGTPLQDRPLRRARSRRDGSTWTRSRRLAREHKPKHHRGRAPAPTRALFDFDRFAEIAREVGAALVVDMAHIAGLVAAGLHPNPVPHADFVTTTTHKTLRGPRGGMILCSEAHAKAVDSQIFPGIQGGPLDARHRRQGGRPSTRRCSPSSRPTSSRSSTTPQALAEGLVSRGAAARLRRHRQPPDAGRPAARRGSPARSAEEALGKAGITVNKNMIPFDPREADRDLAASASARRRSPPAAWASPRCGGWRRSSAACSTRPPTRRRWPG